MIQTLIFLLCFVVSLFILFSLSKNDFVLVRKNISLKQIFDAVFFCSFGFLIAGRFWYILFNNQYYLLSPIRFVHVFRFPGIGLIGGLIGFFVVAYILFKKKKTVTRVFDILSLSIMPIVLYMILFAPLAFPYAWIKVGVIGLMVVLFCIFVYFHKHYSVRDGSITILLSLLIVVANITFLVVNNSLVLHKRLFSLEIIFLSVLFLLNFFAGIAYRRSKKA